MIELAPKIICPFCFTKFTAQELCFRCVIPTCSGRANDTVFSTARGYASPTVMGRVLTVAKRRVVLGVPQDATCDSCHNISRTRICPACHFELTQDVGQIDQRIIAIIGGRATGKSHYIASLITRLQHVVGKNFNLTIRMLGDDTQARWDRDFYTPLFIRKTVLQPTRTAEVNSQVKAPLIFRITLNNGLYRRAINISFFDSAGEDMTSLNTMSVQNRYICYANGIIFLLDPLQIPSVRESLRGTFKLPDMDPRASPENIVGRLRDLFERQFNMKPTQKVKVPIAFTLSKADTLLPLIDPGSAIRRPGEHVGHVDLDDVQSVSTEISNYFSTWISPNFCDIINNNFSSYRYFGVSSLGEQPDAHDHLSTVSPLRVEDPFLWILSELGLIRGKKGR